MGNGEKLCYENCSEIKMKKVVQKSNFFSESIFAEDQAERTLRNDYMFNCCCYQKRLIIENMKGHDRIPRVASNKVECQPT